MTKLIMPVILLLLSALGGTVVTITVFRREKRNAGIEMILTWILNSYIEFWILNCFRFILIQGDTILSYVQDGFVCIFDTILIISSTFIYCYCYEVKEQKSNLYNVLNSIICLMVYYIVLLLIGISNYHNMNAAIYSVLLPKSHLFGGMILLVCLSMRTWKNRLHAIHTYIHTYNSCFGFVYHNCICFSGYGNVSYKFR